MDFFKKILAWLAGLFQSSETGSNTEKNQHTLSQSKQPGESLKNTEAELTGNVDSTISHHPSLVSNLKADHQHLLTLYTEMLTEVQGMKFDTLPENLRRFKIDFAAHLNIENTKFYGYLEQKLKENTEEFKEMRSFRRNMRGIEREVIKFIDHWANSKVDISNYQQFIDEATAIAGALVSRIESEEKQLYPIYDHQVA